MTHPTDGALAHWRARFAELDALLGPPALAGLQPAGLRCLDLATRTGATAEALVAAGAHRVWLADSDALLPDFDRRRAVLGEPLWLHHHPRLHEEVGRFDLVVCATGLWRTLEPLAPLRPLVRRTLQGLHALLAPGATLRLVTPARLAPRAPLATRFDPAGRPCNDGTLLRVEQHLDGVRHELRMVEGLAPCLVRGPDLEPEAWALELDATGFDLVRLRPLAPPEGREDDPGLVLLTARRAAVHPGTASPGGILT